jgi:hypothetical protein
MGPTKSSPRVIVSPPVSRFCPWSTLRPPHDAVGGNGEPIWLRVVRRMTATERVTASTIPPSLRRDSGSRDAASRCLHVPGIRFSQRIDRTHQKGDRGGLGHELAQQFEPLWARRVGVVGQRIIVLSTGAASEIDAALATVARQQAGALIVNADPLFSSRQDQVVALAARYRIPTNYFNRDFTAAGGLMTNVDDRAESLRQAYIYVGRILKGEKPVALPVIQPTKFDLVSNLKTAKELGLTVPPALLNRADEIIE